MSVFRVIGLNSIKFSVFGSIRGSLFLAIKLKKLFRFNFLQMTSHGKPGTSQPEKNTAE